MTIFDEAVRNVLKIHFDKDDFRFKPKRLNKISGNFLERYVFGGKEKALVEGLVKTFPIETAKKHFINYLGMDESQFIIDENNGVKMAYIVIPNVADNIKIVEKGMEFYGYYLAKVTDVSGKISNIVELAFEPKHQDFCNNEVRKMKYLYHVTPSYRIEKIMKNGLCPRHDNNNVYFPERIYLLSEKSLENEIKTLSYNLNIFLNKEKQTKEYAVLTIDTNLIPANVNFRKDGNYERGFWTTENIPPSCIVNVKNIEIN